MVKIASFLIFLCCLGIFVMAIVFPSLPLVGVNWTKWFQESLAPATAALTSSADSVLDIVYNSAELNFVERVEYIWDNVLDAFKGVFDALNYLVFWKAEFITPTLPEQSFQPYC